MNIEIMRACMHQWALAMQHDRFSRTTRNQLKQVVDAPRELKTPPDPPKRPIRKTKGRRPWGQEARHDPSDLYSWISTPTGEQLHRVDSAPPFMTAVMERRPIRPVLAPLSTLLRGHKKWGTIE